MSFSSMLYSVPVIEPEAVFQVTLENRENLFVAYAAVLDKDNKERHFHWLDPQYNSRLAIPLSDEETITCKAAMRRIGWEESLIDAASQFLVLEIKHLKLGYGLFGSMRSLLAPTEELTSDIRCLHNGLSVKQIVQVTQKEAGTFAIHQRENA